MVAEEAAMPDSALDRLVEREAAKGVQSARKTPVLYSGLANGAWVVRCACGACLAAGSSWSSRPA